MPEKQITEKQHYVPQVYLQSFSQDGINIYEYNFKKAAPIPTPVPIESVCREKFLYEQRDENGALADANYLEDILCGHEGRFAEFRRQLLRKVRKDNFETRSFLSKEEKDFWSFYATLQMMRNPFTISSMKEEIEASYPDERSTNWPSNFALELCLPFFQNMAKEKQQIFSWIQSDLNDMVITVGFAERGNLLTSDRAMYGSHDPEQSIDTRSLWFPLTPECGILFYPSDLIERSQRNRLVPLTDDWIRKLNDGIAYIASQMVLSKFPFREEELALIKEARSQRNLDDQRKRGAKS